MKLPSGELRVIAFHGLPMPAKRYREEMVLFRSMDGGLTFSEPETLDLPGREPYFSLMDDGTIFITAHILAFDVRNTEDYAHSYLHRSEDGGRTWQTVAITAEGLPGAPREPECILSSRNVLQLSDGTMILGVCVRGGQFQQCSDGGAKSLERPCGTIGRHRQFLWRSQDGGRSPDARTIAPINIVFLGPNLSTSAPTKGAVTP